MARLSSGVVWLSAVLLLLTAWAPRAAGKTASAQLAQHRVLVLYSDHRLLPANIIRDEAIRETFAVATSSQIDFHSEFLDPGRFQGDAQEKLERDYLREKYRDRPPALVIATGEPPLRFLVKYRAELFPNVPVVYSSVAGDRPPEYFGQEWIAGIPVLGGFARTLELALRLHPGTRQVVVVSGTGDRDRQLAEAVRPELLPFAGRVSMTPMTGLTMEELRGALAGLPDETVVLYLTMFEDAAGRRFIPRQALDEFAPASRVPIYGSFDTYVGHGIVGGEMVTFGEIARKSALLGLRILAGEDPQTAAGSLTHQSVAIFDSRQLAHWQIAEEALPQGSEVRHRTQSFWRLYRWHILTAAAIIVSQAALIVALLVQRRRRYRAERLAARERAELNHATRLATVGELTASITHELNQPLGAILRNAEAAELLLQDASPDLEELRAIITDIRVDDRRASDVIDRLRSLLKRHRVETKPLDVRKLVDDVAALVRSDAVSRRVKLETSVPAELPMVKGDRVHLQQVLLNLILNGMDAVNGSEDNRRVSLEARTNGNGVIEIAVSDTGHGISPEIMGQVFEPFFTTKAAGMGMGLSVSRALIEAQGGQLWAESNTGNGATFRFTLKTADPTAAA